MHNDRIIYLSRCNIVAESCEKEPPSYPFCCAIKTLFSMEHINVWNKFQIKAIPANNVVVIDCCLQYPVCASINDGMCGHPGVLLCVAKRQRQQPRHNRPALRDHHQGARRGPHREPPHDRRHLCLSPLRHVLYGRAHRVRSE